MMGRRSLILAAGLAALSVHVPAIHAALLATRAQCVAVCGDAIATDCGSITRRARVARCRRRLLNRCRHLSTATVCPATMTSADAAPAFVQGRDTRVTRGTTASRAFSRANTAGNLIVVYVVWDNPGTVQVSDTRGNTYTAATARQAWGTNWSAQVFYASSILAGSNTVKATFSTAITSFGRVYLHEYSGLADLSPVDVSASAAGTSAS